MAPAIDAGVRPHGGAPTLFINGKPHTGLAFWHQRARDASEDFAREAGVHVYLDTGEQALAARGLLAVHASRSGERELCLREPSRVVNVRTGNVVATHTGRFTIALDRGQTGVWRLLPRP